MRHAALASLLALCIGCASSPDGPAGSGPLAGDMSQPRLEQLLRAMDPGARGVPGLVEFRHDGVEMVCISDPESGRMRIVAPIVAVGELTPQQVSRVLEANFHTARDARYATSQGMLYAAFVHPLGPLTEAELESAAGQVASLARSFGSGYSSEPIEPAGDEPL